MDRRLRTRSRLDRSRVVAFDPVEAGVKANKIVIAVVILASAWGLTELYGKEVLSDLGITRGFSIWLSMVALLILGVARGLWNKVGSSALIGLIATAFKFAGPSTSYCHLLGVASIGLIFDLFASSLMSRDRPQWWRAALVGGLTAYGARTFFVLYSIHVAHLNRWVEGGWDLGLEYALRDGTWVAIAAVVLVPLGYRLGLMAAGDPAPGPAEDPLAAENRD